MKKIVIILGCLSLLINISLAQNASLKYLPYNGKAGTNAFSDANINPQNVYKYTIRAVFTDGRETEASEELNMSLK